MNIDSVLKKHPRFQKLHDQLMHNDDVDLNGLIAAFIQKHFEFEIGDVGATRLVYVKMMVVDYMCVTI